MKEYRVKVWDNEDGPEDPEYYAVRSKVPAQEVMDDAREAEWDNVVLESREVSEWEEV